MKFKFNQVLQLHNRAILISGFLMALFSDQLTKYIWPVKSINQGVIFGKLILSNELIHLLYALLIISLLWLARWYCRHTTGWLIVASYGLLIGAATSNWLDRWFYQGTRDIWPVYGWPIVNNLADWLIVGSGVVIVMTDWLSYFSHKRLEIYHEA